jgi:hypothetical protein
MPPADKQRVLTVLLNSGAHPLTPTTVGDLRGTTLLHVIAQKG